METVKEPAKDHLRETIKESVKDIRLDTLKEQILDTLKEQIRDTLKEQIRDTIKEGAFDPGTTLAEGVTTPGRPRVIPPGPLTPLPGGAQPFAVVTPQSAAAPTGGAAGLQDSIAQLDAQLQQLADQLTQAESSKQWLQAQYNETSALLAQLIQAHEQSGT